MTRKQSNVSFPLTTPLATYISETPKQHLTPNTSLVEHTRNNASRTGPYTDYAGKITLPVALLVGLVGNTITVVTMVTKPFRSMTWSILLTSLAVVDNVVLLAVPFNKPFIAELLGVDIPSMNTATCKVYHFIRRISKMISAWLIVLVCFERFVAVCFPMKVKQICTKRRTAISVVCVFFVSAAYCSLWVSTADIVNGVCVQTVVTPESRTRAMLYIILGSVLIVVLPMTIMLVLTPITCFVLRKHMLLRTQLSSAAGQTDNYTKATTMLVSLCVAYIVLLTPTMAMYNLAFYFKESLLTTRNTTLVILRELSQVLELMNYSSNFFLYTAFNDVFRRRVIHCVTCHRRTVVVTEATSCTQSRNISMVQQNSTPAVSIRSNTVSMDTVLTDYKMDGES
ncbi:growth hormone secretagogue receptor type 1-like [Gigantopelta aegis]|uniref:growth hormone secretagogue receptor type 1-like n=1 Tax=Gigantopelta aegis TaxID=1735272 RepID=UPI001B889CFC|nr:growth hormone secretagogue receptor type 1-like [Gigantopelta aegis]